MRSSTTAGVSLVEESGIGVCTQNHATGSMVDAVRRVGSNVVKEEMDGLFSGNRIT